MLRQLYSTNESRGKEEVVAYSNILLRHLLGWTEENH